MAKVDNPPSLTDAMARVNAKAGRTLRVDLVLGDLDDDGRAVLLAWLNDADMPATRIEAALDEHAKVTGVDVTASGGAITTWRKANGIA